MGDLSREREQAIARSTMYLVAALLSILMILVGMLLLLIFTRAKGPLYGGLLEGGPVNPRPDGSTGR